MCKRQASTSSSHCKFTVTLISNVCLTVVKLQDKEASESMAACCQLLGFSTILQHAVRLIKGLEINMQNGVISVSVCSFISWFKVGGCAANRGGEGCSVPAHIIACGFGCH